MNIAFGVIMLFVIIACVFLMFVILSQNPKGGGLSSTFGGQGTQMFGVQKTNDFMTKATWTLGIIIVALSIFAGVLVAQPSVPQQSPPATTQSK
ncbi:MAG: preprotein translocase subunit SecG [Flavobacteriaceae bacterium]|jgi:preprotein translocase subunit SecG|nr:preprotein translocase subunit SecG [Flavobacteriaceae bacterium]